MASKQSELLVKPSRPGPDGCIQRITTEKAGWEYVEFEVYELQPGQTVSSATGKWEVCLVILAGTATVATKKEKFAGIGTRMSVFEKTPPYSVYVPAGDGYAVTAETALELAVCKAPGTGKYPARLISPDQVVIADRGKGFNQRHVQTILADESEAESLLVVECYTDESNTSSYPSHKHDTDNPPAETYLVETYYHRFDPPQGWGFQRVYVDDRSLDESMAVYDKDVVMVPKGYHPVATIAGYDNYYLNVYYLNVMAGPLKLWKFNWEKDHEWINGDGYPRRK